jgi:hypothetical protein
MRYRRVLALIAAPRNTRVMQVGGYAPGSVGRTVLTEGCPLQH